MTGGWFKGNNSREIGNGEDTLFLTGRWLGDLSLRDKFHMLFYLSKH